MDQRRKKPNIATPQQKNSIILLRRLQPLSGLNRYAKRIPDKRDNKEPRPPKEMKKLIDFTRLLC
jgi:hypothetical protein